jgi:O-antigen ligase
MTVSRTAVVALAVAAVVVVPAWSGPQLRTALKAALLAVVALRLLVPGLLGTLRALLFNAGEDPSLKSRSTAQDAALDYFVDAPLFGRGYHTFVPTRYQFLDNQILLSLVETGILGLLALLMLPCLAAWQVANTRRRSVRPADRDLAQSLLAAVLVGFATWLTFDGLSFASSRSLVLVALGAIAALWRMTREDAALAPTTLPRGQGRPRGSVGAPELTGAAAPARQGPRRR